MTFKRFTSLEREFSVPLAAFIPIFFLFFFLQLQAKGGENPELKAPFSPNVSLKGVVLDSADGKPLSGATVVIEEKKIGQITRKDGNFRFPVLAKGTYTLRVSAVGYTTFRQVIALSEPRSTTIRLAPGSVLSKEITVVGKREKESSTTRDATILTPAELERHRGQNLGETLKESAGITTLETGPSISKPVIRGLHSQRIVIVNDGVRQEGQDWGAEHAPEIDPFSADKIEVLKGAAGVEYGVGAIGGAIRLEPRDLPNFPTLGGELTLNGFSNSAQGAASLLLEGGIPSADGFGWRLQGSARKAASARTPNYVLGNTGFEELSGSVSAGFRGEKFGVEGFISRFGSELGVYRGSHFGNLDDLLRAMASGRPLVDYDFSYAIEGPKQEVRHDVLALRGFYLWEGIGKAEFQYGYQANSRKEFDARRRWFDTVASAPIAAFSLNLISFAGDLKLRHEPIFGLFRGVFGVSALWQQNTGNSLSYLIPNFRAQNLGFFGIENLSLGDWLFSAGGRLDFRSQRTYLYEPKNVPDSSAKYSGTAGSLGAVWQISPEFSVGANAQSAWRAPSVNELYSDGVHHGAATYEIGDRTLQMERSFSVDIGLHYHSETVHLEISGYRNSINNFISLEPDLNPVLTLRGIFPTMRYKQTETILLGADVSFSYLLAEFWRTGISCAFLRGDEREIGLPLFQMPANRATLTQHFHLPDALGFRESYFEVQTLLVARQERFQAGTDYVEPPSGYVLWDINIGSEREIFSRSLRLNLAARNIFDAPYRDYLSRFRYFADNPGRNFVLRLSVSFGEFAKE